MNQIEANVVKSFKKVRDEIENLQHQILELRQKVEDIDRVVLNKERSSVKTSSPKRKR
jgi:hypothetical protein